jgi:hypothetical protein
MEDFINSIIHGGNYDETTHLSYNRLMYGVDSLNDAEHLYIPDMYDSLGLIPNNQKIEYMRKAGIIGTHDYPVYERTLNPSYINKLPPPYDNLYKNIPPQSMISNKARITPIQKDDSYNIHPQNINDSLKPLNKRFKYFVKPTGSYETQSLLNTETDKSIITDFAVNTMNADTDIKHSNIYIPANFYTHQWHVYNKNFIMNKLKNDIIGGSRSIFIDRRLFNELKKLYPTASDYMLRTNYESLIKKHKLNTISTYETIAEKLIRTNGVIARLASLLDGITDRKQLMDKINEIIQFIPFTYLTSKFPSVNRNIMQRNQDLYKLAFICGSTNDSIINDIVDISKYINATIRA